MNRPSGFFAIVLLTCCAGGVLNAAEEKTGVGEIEIIPSIANEAIGERTLLVVPDGSGNSLTQARTPWGELSDATITVQILDINMNPIVNFPGEDIWLEDPTGHAMVLCPGGSIAEQNTDANGETFWILPLRAGGSNQEGILVIVNGDAGYYPPLQLTTNSPDLDGDLVVSLSDVAILAGDFFGAYQFRSDLHRDGDINLLDLTVLAAAWGASCP